MQLRVQSAFSHPPTTSLGLPYVRSGGGKPRGLGKRLRRRGFVCLSLGIALVSLKRSVSHVWSFESPVAAASSEATLGEAQERAFYARRLEPRDSVVLHGAGELEAEGFTRYSAAMAGNRPLLTTTAVDLGEDLATYFTELRTGLQRAETQSGTATVVPEIGLSLSTARFDAHSPSGRRDRKQLRDLVRGLQSLHRPVFLRIGPGANAAEQSYDAGRYASEFRRVARAVRGAGLTEVAIVWEWSPDAELELQSEGARSRDASARWQAFYPGDDFVDWWALSLYSQPAIDSDATAAFLREADRHGFPVMVAEATPRGHEISEGGLLVDSWFRPFFSLIARSRGIKAFAYLGRDWRDYPQWSVWGDTRVEANPEVLRFMQAQTTSPLFAGASRAKAVETLLQLR